MLRKLLEHRVYGIALIGLDHSDDTYRLLASQNVPVVAAWSYAETSPISCIGSDNREAGQLAAQHLLSLGHQRIGLIFPPTHENDRARGRLKAVRSTMKAASINLPDAWIAQSLYSIAQSKTACLDLLRKPLNLTALICGNDIIAQGAIAAAMQLGLHIPQDLSIVGIGDFAGSAEMFAALSTVQIPAHLIGTEVGQYLVERAADHDTGTILRRKINVVLQPRQTSARPAGPWRD